MCKPARMWRIWADIRHFPLSISILVFETRSLTDPVSCWHITWRLASPRDPVPISTRSPGLGDRLMPLGLALTQILRFQPQIPTPAQSAPCSVSHLPTRHCQSSTLRLCWSCVLAMEYEIWSVRDERSLPSFPSEPVLFLCSLIAPARMSVKCWIGCAYSWVLIISPSEDLIFYYWVKW